jgi:hypothetical protein
VAFTYLVIRAWRRLPPAPLVWSRHADKAEAEAEEMTREVFTLHGIPQICARRPGHVDTLQDRRRPPGHSQRFSTTGRPKILNLPETVWVRPRRSRDPRPKQAAQPAAAQRVLASLTLKVPVPRVAQKLSLVHIFSW